MVTLLSTIPSQCFSTNDNRQHWLQNLGPSVHSMEVLPLITPHTELSVLTILVSLCGSNTPYPSQQPSLWGQGSCSPLSSTHQPWQARQLCSSEADMHFPNTDAVGTRL